jgi:uncharacterized membrane protein YphA (DoxX/SURF4 family)
MTKFLTGDNAKSLGLLLARAPLGAYLLAGGFAKFSKTVGVEAFVHAHAAAIPAWFPHAAGEQTLRAIPYAEIVCGASLLFGVVTRVGGFGAALLLALDMLVITGVRATPGVGQPFQPSVICMGVALAVGLLGPGVFCMDQVMWTAGSRETPPAKPSRSESSSARVRVRFAGR